MQTRFLHLNNILSDHRTVIFTLIALAILIAIFAMPSGIAEAGRAVSTGG